MKKLDILSVVFAAIVAAVTIITIVLTGNGSPAPQQPAYTFTAEEMELVKSADSLMRVLTVSDSTDLAVLRKPSVDFNAADLLSDTYSRLAQLMVATVTSPEQDGVGIAAPQVGLDRRVIAVQRFDKEGEPFEVYPNVQIDTLAGEKVLGPEGCLSIPGRRGMVWRYPWIVISYIDIEQLRSGNDMASSMVRDTVSGFTAVIFQHEVDHLDGILYTDRTEDVIPK